MKWIGGKMLELRACKVYFNGCSKMLELGTNLVSVHKTQNAISDQVTGCIKIFYKIYPHLFLKIIVAYFMTLVKIIARTSGLTFIPS